MLITGYSLSPYSLVNCRTLEGREHVLLQCNHSEYFLNSSLVCPVLENNKIKEFFENNILHGLNV